MGLFIDLDAPPDDLPEAPSKAPPPPLFPPVGEEEWESSTLRGWDEDGQEVRLVRSPNGQMLFYQRNTIGSIPFSYNGDWAYTARPVVVRGNAYYPYLYLKPDGSGSIKVSVLGKTLAKDKAWLGVFQPNKAGDGGIVRITSVCERMDTEGKILPS